MGEDDWALMAKTIDKIEAANTKGALLLALKSYASCFGFSHVGIGQLLNPALAVKPLEEYGVSDFPAEFTQTWFDKKLIIHDPIARYAVKSRNAFTWDIAREFSNKFGQRMLMTARDLSLKNGIGVPVVIPKMPIGLVTMCHDRPDFSQKHLLHIELICIHAYSRFLDLIGVKAKEQNEDLSDRETEVLHYVAAGNTNWEIGRILSISEETVKVHNKNIMRKLNSANRAHSVTIGINEGVIMP